MKRWIAALLTIAMLMSCLPLNVLAESGRPQAAGYSTAAEEVREATLQTDELTVKATDSFGKLLLDSMDEVNGTEATAAGTYNEGNRISSVEVEDMGATVRFSAAEDADLVVALYTEDEMEMLASGHAEVTAGQTAVWMSLMGEEADYFVIKAYLLSKEDHAPISPVYRSAAQTKTLEDLADSTIYDYDADRVVNLDEDATTNFLVVNRSTVLEHEENGKNIVVTDDADGLNYVIENASESIQALVPGDTLVCTYGDGMLLIAKVDGIEVSGTTVTISGQDAAIEEVFEQIKIGTVGETGEFEVDTSTCSEELEYEGVAEGEYIDEENGLITDYLFGDGVDGSLEKSEVYKYSFKGTNSSGTGGNKDEVTVSGYLQFKLGIQFAYLLSAKQQ